MSFPHYDGGRILLKDSSTSNWYYVDVGESGGDPYIRVAQQASPTSSSFAEFATIVATNGDFYRVYIQSSGADIYAAITPVSSGQISRIFLKGPTAVLYQLLAVQASDGEVYLQLQLAGTDFATLDLPWRLVTSVTEDVTKRRSIVTSQQTLPRSLASVAEINRRGLTSVSLGPVRSLTAVAEGPSKQLTSVTALPKSSVVIPS